MLLMNISIKRFYSILIVLTIVFLVLVLLLSLSAYYNELFLFKTLISFIVCCLILNVVAFVMLLKHLSQISQLVNHALEIDSGNYNSRNKLNSKNELGILGYTLNRMCESIKNDILDHENMEKQLRLSEERVRNIFDNSPYGIAIATLDGKFIRVNKALCEHLGYDENELLKMGYQDITLAKDLPLEKRLIHQLTQNEIPTYTTDREHKRKDGTHVWSSLSVSLIKNTQGKPEFFVFQILNITQRIQDENSLLDISEKMTITVKELKKHEKEEILLNKLNENLQLCMKTEETYPRIEVIALELFPELSGALSIYNNQTKKLQNKLEWGSQKLVVDSYTTMDCFALRKGSPNIVDNPNKAVPCAHYVSAPKGGYMGIPLIVLGEILGVIHMFAPEGESIPIDQQQVVMSFSNVIKLALSNIKLLEVLHEQAIHDSLTGLYNRRFLDMTLPRELVRAYRSHSSICIAMLDLDFFKKFNDTFGHESGDEVLKFIGKLLNTHFRESDLACRFGGEEFLVVMPDTTSEKAYERLEDIRKEIKSAHLIFNNTQLDQITISIGIAVAPKDGNTLEKIINSADQALYKAKNSGRDKVVIYHSS